MPHLNKEHFSRVLKAYSFSSLQDAEHIIALKDAFPFSQILHTLSARVSKDHNFMNKQHMLQMAAVYSCDRSVLKDIMSTSTHKDVKQEVANTAEAIIQNTATTTESDDPADEIMEDLAKLTELRNNFEMLFVDDASVSKISETLLEKSGKEQKSKKERIIELAKTAPINVRLSEEPSLKVSKRRRMTSEIIDEIAVSKEELLVEDEKQKEQLQIIEKFIQIQPSISGAKDKITQHNDLSTIKTGEFTDNIVSETLVEILIKQGKKDKAVEVLKKLIWKFPQKKAYFAAQIEELKK